MASRKTQKLNELYDAMTAQASRIEFDIGADLKNLKNRYGILKPKDFGKALNDLVQKYTVGESAEVHRGLVERCRSGDIQALRLYTEIYSSGSDNGAAITEFLAATQPSEARLKQLFKEVNGDGSKEQG